MAISSLLQDADGWYWNEVVAIIWDELQSDSRDMWGGITTCVYYHVRDGKCWFKSR